MDDYVLFKSDNYNSYMYTMHDGRIHLLSPVLYLVLNGLENQMKGTANIKMGEVSRKYGFSVEDIKNAIDNAEYYKKIGIIKRYDFKVNKSDKINLNYVKEKFLTLPSIMFEVTELCNLKCKYCAYGELYDFNKTGRECECLNIEKAKALVKFYNLYLKENIGLNLSNQPLVFSFYGGEPLINFDFIKDIIKYIESFDWFGREIKYNMTTNGLLIDNYIEFLCEKNFNITISLDGNKENNVYRIDKNGKESFTKIYSNVKLIKEKYPNYYSSNISFNSVLHDKNSHEEILHFIHKKLHSTVTMSELNTNNLSDNKKEVFYSMFNNAYTSFSKINDESCKIPAVNNPYMMFLSNFLQKTKSVIEIRKQVDFYYERSGTSLITGTCSPFHRSIFLTVKGKLLYCERVNDKVNLGRVTDNNEVLIDFDEIVNQQNNQYAKLSKQCENCYNIHFCQICMFTKKELKKCSDFKNKKGIIEFLSTAISYIEMNPLKYTNSVEEINKYDY